MERVGGGRDLRAEVFFWTRAAVAAARGSA